MGRILRRDQQIPANQAMHIILNKQIIRVLGGNQEHTHPEGETTGEVDDSDESTTEAED